MSFDHKYSSVRHRIERNIDSVTKYLTSGRKDIVEDSSRELPRRSKWIVAAQLLFDAMFATERLKTDE